MTIGQYVQKYKNYFLSPFDFSSVMTTLSHFFFFLLSFKTLDVSGEWSINYLLTTHCNQVLDNAYIFLK